MKDRDLTLDILKAICIISVVYGHIASCGFFRSFVYLFHVGVFFIISGYFLHPDKNPSSKSFFIQKLKRLYLPYLFLCIPLWLLNNLLVNWQWVAESLSWQGIAKRILVCLSFQGSPFLALPGWFLKSLFFALCVTYLVVKKVKSKTLQYIIFALFYFAGVILASSGSKIPWKQDRELVLCTLCFIGYRLQQVQFFSWIQDFTQTKRKYGIIVATLIIGLGLLSTFISIDAYSSKFSFPGVFLFTSFFGLTLCYLIALAFRNSYYISRIFAYIGKHTLAILLLHPLAFKVVSYLYIACHDMPWSALQKWVIPEANGFWTVQYLCVGIGVPLLCNYIFQRFRR